MQKALFPVLAYVRYWLLKEDSYSFQSPFLFNLYEGLKHFIKAREELDKDIEAYRSVLLTSDKEIDVLDLGAGSKKVKTSRRKLADITRYSTSSRKYAQLYQFFCCATPNQTVIELGTCMGISGRYLSRVTKGTVFTLEGSEELCKAARPISGFENMQFLCGQIEGVLPKLLDSVVQIDFALIDANHTYKGTMQSFFSLVPKVHAQSIIAVGDIHWSPAMEKAWREIIAHPSVRLSLDFYECGILFFQFPGEKSHYVVDY